MLKVLLAIGLCAIIFASIAAQVQVGVVSLIADVTLLWIVGSLAGLWDILNGQA